MTSSPCSISSLYIIDTFYNIDISYHQYYPLRTRDFEEKLQHIIHIIALAFHSCVSNTCSMPCIAVWANFPDLVAQRKGIREARG